MTPNRDYWLADCHNILEYRFVFKVWFVWFVMNNASAFRHQYFGSDICWTNKNASRIAYDKISNAVRILKEVGASTSAFDCPESMGYLVKGVDGFVMHRRIWSERDDWPDLEAFTRTREGLEKLAGVLELSLSSED